MTSIEEQVWTEKWRPNGLDEIIGHDEIVDRLEQWVVDPQCPHLLLHGPAGTGKTASVVAFAKDKYGDDWRSNLIQMNASDDRGIDVVRDQIKSRAAEAPAGQYSFKIIYLDECDNLTKDAQQALRRTMEQYTDQTKFFLSCNYPNKIIDPIQSRCVSLPFHRLDDNEIEDLLTRILDGEEIDYDEDVVSLVVDKVNGDARRAVHSLQTSVEDGELTKDVLEVVSSGVDRELVSDLVETAARGDIDTAQNMLVQDVIPEVTDYSEFCKRLKSGVMNTNELPDDVKFYATSQIGELERNILEGCNPQVQILSYLTRLPVIRYMDLPNFQDD